VSGAVKSDRSDAIIQSLNGLGGWGNGNRFQTDFSIPVFFADSSTSRVQVVGADEYCFGGPDCEEVPAQMPVPQNANFEGSSDLTCDISGNTETQGDCHLLVVEKDEGKLYEVYQGTKTGDGITAVGFFRVGPQQVIPGHPARRAVHQRRRRRLPDRPTYPDRRRNRLRHN